MELYSHSEGAPLSEIEAFTEELTGIMEEMKEKLANEGKILEGTEMPIREAPDELWATLTGKNAFGGYTPPPFLIWNTSAFPSNLVFGGTLGGVVNPLPEPSTYALTTKNLTQQYL